MARIKMIRMLSNCLSGAELLLKVTHEYKVLKSVEGVDWESAQSKYSDILMAELPASCEEAEN